MSRGRPRLRLLPERIPARAGEAIGRRVGALGVTPNMITLAGAGGSAAAAWLIADGRLLAAGAVFLASGALDFVDGAVARATGRATPFGAVLDAVMDRVGEALVLAACVWYFAERGETAQAGFAYAALFGSIAVSYVRARGDAQGVATREGLFRRQERVVLLGIGLLADGLTVVIPILAVLANATALQRWIIVGRGLRALDREDAQGGGGPQSSGSNRGGSGSGAGGGDGDGGGGGSGDGGATDAAAASRSRLASSSENR